MFKKLFQSLSVFVFVIPVLTSADTALDSALDSVSDVSFDATSYAEPNFKTIKYLDDGNTTSIFAIADTDLSQSNQIDTLSGLVPLQYGEFMFNQKLQHGHLNFANIYSDNEQLNQIGYTSNGLSLDGFFGSGHTRSELRSQFSSMDPWLFHGGLSQRYRYSGFNLEKALAKGTTLSMSQTTITSNHLEDRVVNAFALNGKTMAISYMEVFRSDAHIGSAYSLATNFKSHKMTADYLTQDNGANYYALSYGRKYKGVNYKVQIQKSENPLFSEKDENKILFSLSLTAGKQGKWLKDIQGETQQAKGFLSQAGSRLLSITDSIAAGVALSSGSSGADTHARFNLQHDAAEDVLNTINPVSIRENREYGGHIYRSADGNYASTTAARGTRDMLSLFHPRDSRSGIPSGATGTATYHTHATYDPRYDNENFSEADTSANMDFGVDGYLGTPGGQFKYHNLQTNSIETLGGYCHIAIQ